MAFPSARIATCLAAVAALATFALPPGRGAESLEVKLEASTTSGVAPLAVFFDALGSGLKVGTPHDARYEWRIADPGAARTKESGFCAAHVFVKPGSYEVVLEVQDKAGNRGSAKTTVKVQEFVGTTIWVSAKSGDDKSDGKGLDKPVRSFDRALALLGYRLGSGGPKTAVRVLFERGGTFTTAKGGTLPPGRYEGPIVFGAYGTAPQKPVIVGTGEDPVFRCPENSAGVRITDLELRGGFDFAKQTGGGAQHLIAFDGGKGHLVHRCDLRSALYGFSAAGSPRTQRSELTIAESTIEEMRDYCAYLGGERLAVLDNRFAKVSQMHVLRLWYAKKAVVVGNELLDPSVHSGLGRHALKLHAFAGDGSGAPAIPTEWVYVAENVLRGSTWPCAIAPQNQELDERIANVVFERNLLLPDVASSALTNQMVLVVARDVTLRENVLVGSARSPDLLGFAVQQYPRVPAPERVRIVGNTLVQCAEDPFTESRPCLAVLFAAIRGKATAAIEVRDNCVHAKAAAMPPTALVALGEGFTSERLEERGNFFFAPRAKVWAWSGEQALGLGEWQAMGRGQASAADDPRFVAPERLDLRPASAAEGVATRPSLGVPETVVRTASRRRSELLPRGPR